MKRLQLLLVPVLLFVSACAQGQVAVDKLVFGTYYGMCKSNCINIYQLDNALLQKDDSAKYGSLDWSYYFTNTRTLSAGKHAIAKDLLQQIPLELFSKNRVMIGAPDHNDQGGIYMLIMSGPASTRFKLDIDDTPDQSAAVIAFKRQLMGVLKQLQ